MPEQFPDFGRADASMAEFEFKEMLDCLEEKYRIVLVLYYVEGFKVAEIAELLDLKENTVKTRLSRAREQIRDAYTDYPGQVKRRTTNSYTQEDRSIQKCAGESLQIAAISAASAVGQEGF